MDPIKPPAGRLYIMRHGRTSLDEMKRSDGWLDLPLSPEGHKSLIAAQQLLKMRPIKTIFTPSLKRTKETADIMKSGIIADPQVVVMDALKTWNLGVINGTKKGPARKREVESLMDHPEVEPQGGESYQNFCARMMPAFEAIAEHVENGGSSILMIASGSNIREISRRLSGDAESFALDEGGLIKMTPRGEGRWRAEVIRGGGSDKWDS